MSHCQDTGKGKPRQDRFPSDFKIWANEARARGWDEQRLAAAIAALRSESREDEARGIQGEILRGLDFLIYDFLPVLAKGKPPEFFREMIGPTAAAIASGCDTARRLKDRQPKRGWLAYFRNRITKHVRREWGQRSGHRWKGKLKGRGFIEEESFDEAAEIPDRETAANQYAQPINEAINDLGERFGRNTIGYRAAECFRARMTNEETADELGISLHKIKQVRRAYQAEIEELYGTT